MQQKAFSACAPQKLIGVCYNPCISIKPMFQFAGPAKQAKQATAKAASSAQQGTQQDLGKQLGNVFGGLKLPWQQGNGASSKPQQVCSAL